MHPRPNAHSLSNVTGGNDVFVDIGDKSWGVLSCQKYLGGIEGSKTLHIGDQFLSAGANDFKVRICLGDTGRQMLRESNTN